MLIEMNRFFTRRQIERLYQIPVDILPTAMADVPVVHRAGNGEPVFVGLVGERDRIHDQVAWIAFQP